MTGREDDLFEGKYSDVTEKIIGAFFTVYNALGYGFSETAQLS